MSTRKRDDYLDLGESDGEESAGEMEQETRGRSDFLRSAKRRKVSGIWGHTDSDDSDNHTDDEVEMKAIPVSEEGDSTEKPSTDPFTEEKPSDALENSTTTKEEPRKPKKKSEKAVLKPQVNPSKTGVIYISRIPPFMTPQMLRKRLEPYGELGRVYLTPESHEARAARKKAGGTSRKSFADGWVEFLKKSQAKLVAELLNTKTMGGKKRGFYYDDVWNIKYLKGFKWHHLTEQIANENAERAARMRAEIARTTKENKLFLQNVETAKMLEGMEAKAKGKAKAQGADEEGGESGEPSKLKKGPFVREFRQNRAKIKTDTSTKAQPEVTRVLSKIF